MGKSGAIRKCERRGWIKNVTDTTPEKDDLGFKKRNYYMASVDPIIEKINKEILPEDDYFLRKILTSKAFRYSIKKVH